VVRRCSALQPGVMWGIRQRDSGEHGGNLFVSVGGAAASFSRTNMQLEDRPARQLLRCYGYSLDATKRIQPLIFSVVAWVCGKCGRASDPAGLAASASAMLYHSSE
jgi:hypothetical protein